ncbi:hypothetical protein [Komagataeibacter oboediens]|uniref:hypothetical protein n=1 Tax=Komagataeibacter oboediens TaxID=65958 RepID=UPI0038D21AFB
MVHRRKSIFTQFQVEKGSPAWGAGVAACIGGFLLLAITCLTGCSDQPRVATTIPQAMASIQSSLAQSGAVAVPHAGNWTPEMDARFTTAVRSVQCSQHTADPVMGVLAGTITGTLSIQFTAGGQATVGALTSMPTVGVEASGSRTRGQTLSIPLSYASLSSLPDVEMSRQLGYETEMLAQNDDARHKEADRLIADREELRGRVQVMIDSWGPVACAPVMPFVPLVGVLGR